MRNYAISFNSSLLGRCKDKAKYWDFFHLDKLYTFMLDGFEDWISLSIIICRDKSQFRVTSNRIDAERRRWKHSNSAHWISADWFSQLLSSQAKMSQGGTRNYPQCKAAQREEQGVNIHEVWPTDYKCMQKPGFLHHLSPSRSAKWFLIKMETD